MEKKQVIVFEGLNGSGKSTIAKLLAKDINAIYLESPPLIIQGIRCKADEEFSLQTRCLYYLLGNSIISDIIKKIRRENNVICDRYIHSTLSVHNLLGIELGVNVDFLNLAESDLNLFFYVSNEKERLARINSRGKKTKYDILQEDENFCKRYIDYFSTLGNFIFVDTGSETPIETLHKVKLIINKGERNG